MALLDVLMINQYGDVTTPRNRFSYLAERLAPRVGHLEFISSAFSHRTKRPRVQQTSELPFDLTLIPEPGYRGNVSIARIASHRQLGRNLAAYLQRRAVPDVVYCAVPSLAVAEAAAVYAQSVNTRLILDVQDLWPEAFTMVLRPRTVASALLAPLARRADKIYRSADAVVTVSETYSARVSKARGSSESVHSVYLGTDLGRFDEFASAVEPTGHPGEIWLAYVGTLGASYDLPTVFKAMQVVQQRDVTKIRLIVMGRGPREEHFRGLAAKAGVTVDFRGMLSYPEMVRELSACDIAVNPIVAGSAGSVINKVCDYAAAGLPVLNTQESPEYRNLISSFQAGVNLDCEDPVELAEAIISLVADPKRRRTLGEGNRRLAEQLFDRRGTYQEIVQLIEDGA